MALLALARHDRRPPRGRVAAACLVLSLLWVQNLTLRNTYALGGLFVALAAVAFAAIERPGLRLAATLLCGVLAAGCRLSLAPFGAILAAALVLEAPRGRRLATAARAAAVGVAISLLLFGPFLFADAEATWFWTVGFHLASTLERRGATSLREAAAVAPAVVLAAAGALALWRRSFAADPGASRARVLLVAALATAAANLAARAPYGGYVTPVAGVLARRRDPRRPRRAARPARGGGGHARPRRGREARCSSGPTWRPAPSTTSCARRSS